MENVINFDLNEMGSTDIQSMFKVINAYMEIEPINLRFYDISETGFNQSSGYVYIALENGISIVSCFGQGVQYMVTSDDSESFSEYFFDTHDEAKAENEKLNDISY